MTNVAELDLTVVRDRIQIQSKLCELNARRKVKYYCSQSLLYLCKILYGTKQSLFRDGNGPKMDITLTKSLNDMYSK